MRSNGKQLAMFSLFVLLLVGSSGCQLIDKLKARDQLNKGTTAYKSKRYDEAIRFFEEATRLDPDLIQAELYLATTYRTMYVPGSATPENEKNAKMAIAKFEEVLKKDSKNITAMASIARTYSDLGDFDRAKEWYRKRLEADPSNPEPLYGIGSTDFNLVYPKTGPNGELVKDLSDKEKEDLMRLVDEGIDVLKKALEIKPEYSDAAQFLNLLYREKAKLSSDEAEKDQWLKEADKLALRAMEMQKKQKEEEERQRKSMMPGKAGK